MYEREYKKTTAFLLITILWITFSACGKMITDEIDDVSNGKTAEPVQSFGNQFNVSVKYNSTYSSP